MKRLSDEITTIPNNFAAINALNEWRIERQRRREAWVVAGLYGLAGLGALALLILGAPIR